MVYRRYTPVLATFDDVELRSGVDEIRDATADLATIELVQRFDLAIGLAA
jgi:hypothetical protein